jgi:hypothetical protein
MSKLDWNEEEIIGSVRAFIKEDATDICANSAKYTCSPEQSREFGLLASNAMVDLLCIRYHNEAVRNCLNYKLTYEGLKARI